MSISLSTQAALDDIGAENNRMVPKMTRWAVYADNAIGGYRLLKYKITVQTFDHCSVELPCDIVALLPGMLLGDYGCECDLVFNDVRQSYSRGFVGVSNVDGFTVVDTSSFGTIRSNLGNYQIQDNKLVFKTNYEGQKLTIPYLGMQLDERGLPMILENHVEACAQYIQYKLAKMTRFQTKEYRLNETAIEAEKREWNRMCRHARANDIAPTEQEEAAVAALINNPYSGIQRASWIYGMPNVYGILPV